MEEMDLGRAEAVDVDLREMRLDVAEQFLVPLERELGVQPALHQHARTAQIDPDALHEDVEKNISRDMEPYLVKDAEVSMRISVNDERPAMLRGEPVIVPNADRARLERQAPESNSR